MPIGLLVLIGLSILVYRRAQRAHRNRFLWVVLLWVITLATGMLGAAVAGLMAVFGAERELSERELQSAVLLPTAIGMFVGAVISVWASGRKPKNRNDGDRTS